MYLAVLLFGILAELSCVSGTTGVIDISDLGQRSLFSGPSKLGEALFYKLTCNDNGSYSNVFDGSERLFPIRSHTRLVGLVLGTKNESPELLQVMYSDVAKDYSYRSLYYFRAENSWQLTDSLTYKFHLLKLKNNHVNFDIKSKNNKYFYTDNTSHNPDNTVNDPNDSNSNANNLNDMAESVENVTTRYYVENGMELDKVCNGDAVIWKNDFKYDFKYLELTEGPSGPETLTIHYSNHPTNFSNHYSNQYSNRRWVHDFLTTTINLSNRSSQLNTAPENSVGGNNISDLVLDVKKLFLKDALNLDEQNPMINVVLNVKFEETSDCTLTVNGYQYYGLSTYELLQPSGCSLISITDNEDVIFENKNEYTISYFQVAKFNFTNHQPTLLISITDSKKLTSNFTSDHNNDTLKHTFHLKSYPEPFNERDSTNNSDSTNFNNATNTNSSNSKTPNNTNNTIKNINNTNNTSNGVWECVEYNLYNRIMNGMMQLVTSLEMKKMFESPPVTVNVTPSTPSLDYGGLEPFTYDLSNPVEPRLQQDFLSTDPDLIKLQPQPGYAVNVIVDGDNVLWEQTADGPGCHLVFIYRSESSLLSHIVTNSHQNPHLFFKFNGQSWYPISQEQYEDFKLKDTKGKGRKQHFDEYSTTLTDTADGTSSNTNASYVNEL
uniref:Signal peptide-containing protein n=1 Tax=Theileria parva TaxID=5875 RepID=Q4N0E8_THEPA|eukprot:XP_763214.1 hypothetical protein [Theileria parva strain Muguga]